MRVWLSVGEGVGKDVGEGVCVMSMLPGLRLRDTDDVIRAIK